MKREGGYGLCQHKRHKPRRTSAGGDPTERTPAQKNKYVVMNTPNAMMMTTCSGTPSGATAPSST